MFDNVSVAFHVFGSHMLTLLSVDETLLPRYYNKDDMVHSSYTKLLFINIKIKLYINKIYGMSTPYGLVNAES